MILHVSYPLFFTVAAVIAVLIISNALILRWFMTAAGLLRAEKLDRRIGAIISSGESSFAGTIQAAFKKFEVMEERVRKLETRLTAAAQRFVDLTPEGVKNAVNRQIDFVAEEKVKEYKAAATAAQENLALYLLWLRALVGGPSELQRAAAQGYPSGLPNDLVVLLDLFCDQRRVRVRGRNRGGNNPPSPNEPVI